MNTLKIKILTMLGLVMNSMIVARVVTNLDNAMLEQDGDPGMTSETKSCDIFFKKKTLMLPKKRSQLKPRITVPRTTTTLTILHWYS